MTNEVTIFFRETIRSTFDHRKGQTTTYRYLVVVVVFKGQRSLSIDTRSVVTTKGDPSKMNFTSYQKISPSRNEIYKQN